ncbi:hypothetical protein AcW1_000312 [Taiwanofungus camphoratus]|nr:hypothetical protein AcV5_004213 [Antrodia cinnamomea]KAI0963152.1 hypothetical protein AcW1_000312 [Antrodia cinnamomea]
MLSNMSSVQIQALLRGPSVVESEKQTLDFLNSHFTSLQDLEGQSNLSEMVEEAKMRTDSLKAELSQVRNDVDALIAKTRSSAKEQLSTAQQLSLMRHSLADELSYLSQELVSSLSGSEGKPTLLEDLETLHRSLKELESVKGYVQVIEHALKLSESAVRQISNTSTLSSVSEYEALRKFVASVQTACAPAEDVADQQRLHILSFLEAVQDKTWSEMKNALSSSLLSISERLHWPMPVDYVAASSEDRAAFESAFLNLLKLQAIGAKLHAPSKGKNTEHEGLYSIQALVQPVSLRFKYHFEGTRQTNRLDKPEWYFTHILNVSYEHRPFMESIVRNLLSPTEYRGINAWREFTVHLLPLLARKLKRTVPALLPHPPLLAHTIYEALSFDSSLKEEGFSLAGTTASKYSKGKDDPNAGKEDKDDKWEGISEVVLGRKEWFEAWMEGERKFAMDQYVEIISASDAWIIADDEHDVDDMTVIDRDLKPTNSARRVKGLVEQVTDRYSPLPEFGHRTRFLIAVQLPILESYHARISSSLDAFETLSSTFMRAVPGALSTADSSGRTGDTKRLTSGVEGVQRLCKALISAKYMGAALEAWGEDLFFLELWTEINHRASLRSRVEAEASLPDPKHSVTEVPEGTIFEELVVQYGKLAERAEDMIVQCVCGEIEAGLRAHFTSGSSTQVTPNVNLSPKDNISLAPTLLAPIALLSSHLSFLQTTLAPVIITSLYRRIGARLSSHILQRQILYRGRGRISPQEGKAIMAESELWVETCQLALARTERARVESPWRQLLQASRLVGAEGIVWQEVVDATLGVSGDQQWEEVMLETVGFAELGREEAGQILRTRADCER